MNLYHVTKSYYVAAESVSEAEYASPDITACDTDVEEVGDIEELDDSWRSAIPFGDNPEGRTCEDILEVKE